MKPQTAADARALELRHMTEAEWQNQVIDCAHLQGWTVAHFRPARTAKGWATPVAADGAGFPDLCMVRERDGRLVFAELKRYGQHPSPAQRAWLAILGAVTAAEVYVWYPQDWETVQKVLI